jgi:hypothetical protein
MSKHTISVLFMLKQIYLTSIGDDDDDDDGLFRCIDGWFASGSYPQTCVCHLQEELWVSEVFLKVLTHIDIILLLLVSRHTRQEFYSSLSCVQIFYEIILTQSK